ncbi:Uncharacterised protein [Mycobacterium tuberculosis]|nr:Uncharacterised protein [Mycobacterium tuberculosis]
MLLGNSAERNSQHGGFDGGQGRPNADQGGAVPLGREDADPRYRCGDHRLSGHRSQQERRAVRPGVNPLPTRLGHHAQQRSSGVEQCAAQQQATHPEQAVYLSPQHRTDDQSNAGKDHQHVQTAVGLGGAQAEERGAQADRNEQQVSRHIPAKPRLGAGDREAHPIDFPQWHSGGGCDGHRPHRADEQRRDAGANQTCGAQPQQIVIARHLVAMGQHRHNHQCDAGGQHRPRGTLGEQ